MNLPDIVQMVTEAKEKNIKVYPCHTNRVSQIGEECLRKLVYMRTSWDKQLMHDVGLQFIFDGGNTVEKHAEEDLRAAGIEVFEQQRSLFINDNGENITGHFDNRLRVNKFGTYTCEIKGLAQWTWEELNKPEDFFKNKRAFVRKYPAQLLLYLYGSNEQFGAFYLVNKQTWQPKVVWFNLFDYTDYVDSLLEKAKTVNKHVDDGTLPDYTTDTSLCGTCNFNHICLPPIEHQNAIFINEELEDLLIRREELKEAYSEYNKIDKQVKPMVKGKDKIVCGDFLITGKKIVSNIKAVAAHQRESWRTTIKKLNNN